MSEPWTKVGTICLRKDGNGSYLKLDLRKGSEKLKTLTLTADTILNIQDPRKRKGITEEQLAKIPDFVRAEVFLPPPREND